MVRGSKELCGSKGVCVCVQGMRGPQGDKENLGRRRNGQGLRSFLLISEVTGRGFKQSGQVHLLRRRW